MSCDRCGDPGRNLEAALAHLAALRGQRELTSEQEVHAAALLTIAIELDGDGTEKSPRPTPTLVREQRATLEALAPKGAAGDGDDDADWIDGMPPPVRDAAQP